MLLHRSDLNILAKFRQTSLNFSANFVKFRHFGIIFIKICSDFDENLSEFRQILSKMLNIPDFFKFLMNSNKISWILTELWSEKFEWFGPSPIEPFNLGKHGQGFPPDCTFPAGGQGQPVSQRRAGHHAEVDSLGAAGNPRRQGLSRKIRSARDRTIRTFQSSVRILAKFRNFRWKIQNFRKF